MRMMKSMKFVAKIIYICCQGFSIVMKTTIALGIETLFVRFYYKDFYRYKEKYI